MHQTWTVSTRLQSVAEATNIDYGVCRTREQPLPVLRQTQPEYAALVRVYDSTALVCIEAEDLRAISYGIFGAVLTTPYQNLSPLGASEDVLRRDCQC